MDNFLNINIEFDHDKVDSIIQNSIQTRQKGYVCSVDRNIFTIANKDSKYNKIINSALVNICDSSYAAFFYSLLKRKRIKPYIGADLFIKYIKMKKYNQVFLGSTPEILDSLKRQLQIIDPKIAIMRFMPLPFMDAEDFDYENIAKEVNLFQPDIIWVSLGAPKQEQFMYYLLPKLNQGIMFGFGAILNFYSGFEEFKRAPKIMLKIKLEWLYRLYQEPKKQWQKIKNFLGTFPSLLLIEFRKYLIKTRK